MPAAASTSRASSFGLAFRFLPRQRREALEAVYGYCRLVDDAADDAASPAEAASRLAAWSVRLAAVYAPGSLLPADDEHRELLLALRRAAFDYHLRREDFAAVLEGCAWDVTRTRYESFAELREYCLRVASAVGLLCLPIFGVGGGAREPRARDYATDLGVALQLTNILRDLDEDAARGRVYLPQEDLRAFGVSDEELRTTRSSAVLRLLDFQARRAHLHYLRARAALSPAERAHLLPAELMADLYHALLERLQRERYPRRRIALSATEKAGLLAARLVRSRLGR